MSLNQILKFRFEVRDLGEGVQAERIDGGVVGVCVGRWVALQ